MTTVVVPPQGLASDDLVLREIWNVTWVRWQHTLSEWITWSQVVLKNLMHPFWWC